MAYITLNKDHFFHNLDIITNRTKTKEKIALVLKDNAYGHGLLEIAKLAKEYGLTKCVVQSDVEAQKVEEFFEYILVLADFPLSYSAKRRYTINDINAVSKFPKGTRVELKVDTGMHRNGIAPKELYETFKKIQEQGLCLEAVFTHHRSADELSSEWFWQNDIFKEIKVKAEQYAEEFAFATLRFHSANSASLFRSENFSEDMARVGIVAYGSMELAQGLKNEEFKPVLSLFASKISSRELKVGARVGYGATYKAQKNEVVSNYDFGYGDGFLRQLSNNYITPDGYKQVGRVSMDNSSFVTDKESIKIFESAIDVAKFAGTIPYEVLTSLAPYIKREVV
jgi:alanine racemase